MTRKLISTSNGAKDIGIGSHSYNRRAITLKIKPAIKSRMGPTGRTQNIWHIKDHELIKNMESQRGKWKRN